MAKKTTPKKTVSKKAIKKPLANTKKVVVKSIKKEVKPLAEVKVAKPIEKLAVVGEFKPVDITTVVLDEIVVPKTITPKVKEVKKVEPKEIVLPKYVQFKKASDVKEVIPTNPLFSVPQKDNMTFVANCVKNAIEREDRWHFKGSLIELAKGTHPNCDVDFQAHNNEIKITFTEGLDSAFIFVSKHKIR